MNILEGNMGFSGKVYLVTGASSTGVMILIWK